MEKTSSKKNCTKDLFWKDTASWPSKLFIPYVNSKGSCNLYLASQSIFCSSQKRKFPIHLKRLQSHKLLPMKYNWNMCSFYLSLLDELFHSELLFFDFQNSDT